MGTRTRRTPGAFRLGAALALAVQGWTAYASNRWQGTGPCGGFLLDLEVCASRPDVLYAACDSRGGVFRSTDGAVYWVPAGLASHSVYSVSVDPSDPDRAFAGTDDGVFRSLDGGETWVSVGLTGECVLGLAIHPYNAGIVFAGSYDAPTGSGYGAYRSLAGGDPGTFATCGLAPNLVIQFDFDADDTNKVYAATGSGIFRTSDNGDSWTLFPTPDYHPMRCVASAGGGMVYAGSIMVPSSGFSGAVFRTQDDGTNWAMMCHLTGTVWDIAIDPNDPVHVYAAVKDSEVGTLGVWESQDGTTWQHRTSGLADRMAAALAVHPLDSGRLYVGVNGEGGVYLSTNGAASWAQAERGMSQMLLQSLVVVKTGGEFFVYGGAGLGIDQPSPMVWRLPLGSRSWEAMTPFPVCPGYENYQMFSIWGMAASTQAPGTIYAAGMAHQAAETQRAGMFWRSEDGGATWDTNVYIDDQRLVYCVAVGADGSGGENVYIGLGGSDTTLVYGVRKSTNGGRSFAETSGWAAYPGLPVLDIEAAPQDASRIYAATAVGLTVSTNHGDSWTLVGPEPERPLMYTVWADPDDADHVLAGVGGWLTDSGGVWETTNAGGSWRRAGLTNYAVTALASFSNTVYAGTGGQLFDAPGKDVWRADLANLEWERLSTNDLPFPFVLSMIHGREVGLPGELFVSTFIGGAYVFTAEEDWDRDGLPDAWENDRLGGPFQAPWEDLDADCADNLDEYVGGTDPTETASYPFDLTGGRPGITLETGGLALTFGTVAVDGPGYDGKSRHYALDGIADLLATNWLPLAGWADVPGDGLGRTCVVVDPPPVDHFRGRVWLDMP